jgi:lysozyme-related protein Hpa2
MNIVPLLLVAASLCCSTSARADCFDDAAQYQNVSARILRAIAWVESRGRGDAMHVNHNGSVDYGIMQINSIHLRTLGQYGISAKQLMSPCVNIYVAAWHLKAMVRKYGNTWTAVGAYHSESPAERERYIRSIRKLFITTVPSASSD